MKVSSTNAKVKLKYDVNSVSLISKRYSILASVLCTCYPDYLTSRVSLLLFWVFKVKENISWVNFYARNYLFGLMARTPA